jgi:hypothetical protein
VLSLKLRLHGLAEAGILDDQCVDLVLIFMLVPFVWSPGLWVRIHFLLLASNEGWLQLIANEEVRGLVSRFCN